MGDSMLMDLKKLLPGIDKNGKYRLPRLQDIVQNEDYIIVYGYTHYAEGIFQKYYFDNGRWQLLRCRNLPYHLRDFSMVLYQGKFLIINGRTLYDDSSYTTLIGYLTEQGLFFEKIDTSSMDVSGKWISQRILTDDNFIFIVTSHVSKETEISVYNIDIMTKKWKLHGISSKSLPRQNVKYKAVYYNNRIFMFTHTLLTNDNKLLFKFENVDVFDLSADRWEQVETSADSRSGRRPSARDYFGWTQCVADKHYVYMTGGLDAEAISSEVWRLDLRTVRWSDVTAQHDYGPPCLHRMVISPAGRFTYILDNQRMVRLMRMMYWNGGNTSEWSACTWLPLGDVRKTGTSGPRDRHRAAKYRRCFR